MASAEPEIVRAWEWERTEHGDPRTYHCDIIDYCQLDFYAESHHPEWNGWFDIGKQSLSDFLESGPLTTAASMPQKIRAEITACIKDLQHKNLIVAPPLVIKKPTRRFAGTVSHIYAPPLDPLYISQKETCQLTIWVEVPEYPELRLTDLTLSLGSRCYERHEYDDPESPLQQASRILVLSAPATGGAYPMSVHTSLARAGKVGVEFSPYIQMVPVQIAGANVQLQILCEAEGVRIVQNAPPPATPVRISLSIPHFPRVRLKALAVWQGRNLLWQERQESPTYFSNFHKSEEPLDRAWQIDSPEILLPGKEEKLRGVFWYSLEDEPDWRKIELMSNPAANIRFVVPAELPGPSATQQKKRNEINALEKDILDAVRNGMLFYTADKEGGWMQIYWRGNAFWKSYGSYAENTSDAAGIAEDTALQLMLADAAMGFMRADRLTLLQSIRQRLRARS